MNYIFNSYSSRLKKTLAETNKININNISPTIGISTNTDGELSCVNNYYVNCINEAGGIPIIIPFTNDTATLIQLLKKLDGIIISGGGDINPLFFGEEPSQKIGELKTLKDEFDLKLIKIASDRQIPIFGICRGHQLINYYFGGTNYQDIYSETDSKIKHSQNMPKNESSHSIYLKKDSVFTNMIGKEIIEVNSFHHQAIKKIASGFKESAVSSDGINEGIEALPTYAIFSVQWHPECMAQKGNDAMIYFEYLIYLAGVYMEAKDIHDNIITIDSHCDTPMFFSQNINIGEKNDKLKVDLVKMNEGKLDAEIMVAYLPQGKRDDDSLLDITNKTFEILQEIKEQVHNNNSLAEIAYNYRDALRIKKEGKKSIFLGIENGYAIGKDITNIAKFKELGVVYITLCHNGDNDICDSAKGNHEHGGLSEFGKEVIAEMNRLGIMIDISHTNEDTINDVLEISKYPIIASHSSARAICNHPRNITDEQIKLIAQKGGVIQVCLYNYFLKENGEASTEDALRHINHIINIAGIDHVGIGSDFDGGGEIKGCSAVNEMINLTVKMLEESMTKEDIKKIWGGNIIRVMEKTQKKQ